MDEIRVVVDTNIFIKALFFKDQFCKTILQLKKLGKITFVMNKEMQLELVRVFGEILIQTFKKSNNTLNIYPLLSSLSLCLWQVEEIDHIIYTEYCEDHDDDKFVDCCIDGNVKYLITEDHHLNSISKKLFKKHNIEVLSSFQFYVKHQKHDL